MNAITATNANLPAGRITRGVRENLVRIEGKMKEAAEFKRIIVANRRSGPVYLSQVADITDGAAEEQSISRVNGERAISLEIAKIQDANTVQVGNGVKAAIEAMKSSPRSRPSRRCRPGRCWRPGSWRSPARWRARR